MVDNFGYPNAYKDFSAKRPLYPLHSMMKIPGSNSLQPAKTVSFSLPDVTEKKHDILESEWRSPASNEAKAQPIQDMEAAKQAVAFILSIPEVIVQLVIDAHHLDLDPGVSFKDTEELAKVAMEVAQSPQRQADLAMKVHQVRKENKHGDKTGLGGAEGVAKSGAGVWASKDGCESHPSEMLADSSTQCPSSGAAPFPSCSPSSSSSSFSSDVNSSSNASPLSSSSSASLPLLPPTTTSSVNSSANPGCCLSEMSVVETSTGNTTYDKQEKQICHDASSNSPSSTHADDSSNTWAKPGSDTQPIAISASEKGKTPASILIDPQHHPSSSLEPPKESAQNLHPTDATESLKQQLRKRVQRLAVENRKLKNRKVCRACQKVDLAESGITFLPCGHFITCENCSEMFDDCPACGKKIMGTVRTFLS